MNILHQVQTNMAIVSRLGPSYQIVADTKFIKQTWISLTKCCEKFREMVYNCSHFMQEMLPQVDGLTYLIQHRSTHSMNFVIQGITKFFTAAKLHDSCQILVTDCLSEMGLCGHSFHVSKLFYPIFSLSFTFLY